MSKSFEIKAFIQEYVGVSPAVALAIVAAFGAAGVSIGLAFPKFEAKALLAFPEKQVTSPGNKLFELPNNVIELPLYKRIEASYDSTEQLSDWLAANGVSDSAVAQRLLNQSRSSKFWSSVSTPVLPFSKQDQKVYGDIKDASSTQLIGLQLSAGARNGALASEMVEVMARYYTGAVLRERIRTWVIDGRVEAQGTTQMLRGEIIRAQLEMSLAARRVADMQAVIARHPEAARMESRQVVNVNENEGGDRYLSPVAQMVGAETRISQQKELILRLERRIQQRELLANFFGEASQLVDSTLNAEKLLNGLRDLAGRQFASADIKQEWVEEALLRINGAIDAFRVMQNQIGIRNGVSVAEVASRDPVRLGALGLALGLGLLGGIAFVRAGLRSMREGDAAEVEPDHARKA